MTVCVVWHDKTGARRSELAPLNRTTPPRCVQRAGAVLVPEPLNQIWQFPAKFEPTLQIPPLPRNFAGRQKSAINYRPIPKPFPKYPHSTRKKIDRFQDTLAYCQVAYVSRETSMAPPIGHMGMGPPLPCQ